MVVVLPGSKNQQRPLLRMISWVHGWWFYVVIIQHVPQLSMMMIYDYLFVWFRINYSWLSMIYQQNVFIHNYPTFLRGGISLASWWDGLNRDPSVHLLRCGPKGRRSDRCRDSAWPLVPGLPMVTLGGLLGYPGLPWQLLGYVDGRDLLRVFFRWFTRRIYKNNNIESPFNGLIFLGTFSVKTC